MATDTIIEKKTKTTNSSKEPGKFKVIVCNDDVTPMEFVIAMLMRVFKHTPSGAEALTMKIHHEGSAIAGIYSYEIAEQKCVEGTNMAREHNFPLVLKAEPA